MAQPVISKTFALHEGNLQPRINCVIQSSNGYLLCGSSAGLFLFNGIQYEKIPADSQLTSNDITAACEVRPGVTWVGYQDGSLAVFAKGIVKKLVFEEGSFKKTVTKIIADSAGNIWCSTAGEGVYLFNGKHWINFNTDDGISDNYVYDIAIATRNQMICGTDNGVNFLTYEAAKKYVRHSLNKGASIDKIIRRILPLGNGRFLAGTQSANVGVCDIHDPDVKKQGIFPDASSQVNGLATTGAYNWIATQTDGVWYTNSSAVACTPAYQKLVVPHNKINGLLADVQHNIWLFTDNLLIKTSGDRLLKMNMTDSGYSMLHTLLGSRSADGTNSIWFDYNGGLKQAVCSNGFGVTTHIIPGLKNKAEITCIYYDSTGRFWIGTMGMGLWFMDSRTYAITQVENKLLPRNANILSISGSHADVWITGLEGIVKASLLPDNTNHFENFTNTEKLGTNYVYNIFTDSKGTTWFATDGKGVTAFAKGRFTNYNARDGLNSKVIYSIAEDRYGKIWMNTLNDGLYYFDGKKFRQLSAKDGLTDNNISNIITGLNGNIIAFSKNAIDIIDPATFSINTVDEEQGIKDLNTDLHSASLSADGCLYFSTATGIYLLNTNLRVHWPVAYIDHAELFLADFDIDSIKQFNAEENNLGIHFNATDLDHPDKVQFSYMLEGFGNTWINTKDKYVNFPKLPPGSYTFRVKASLSSNFSHSAEAVYSFVILKPFWLRWWFIAMVIFMLAAGVWLLIYLREQHQRRWQELKQENMQSQLETLKSQVSPHFFFNSLNTLVALIEEAPKTAVHYTNHLSDFFRKMLQYRFQDLISLEEELDMIDDYSHIQRHRFEGSLRLENSINDAAAKMYKVAPLTLQLLVENAIKHNAFTEADPLIIKLFIAGSWLVVSNNKKQKINPETGAGVGLHNIMRRYKLLTGKDIIIENNLEHFTVSVPLI